MKKIVEKNKVTIFAIGILLAAVIAAVALWNNPAIAPSLPNAFASEQKGVPIDVPAQQVTVYSQGAFVEKIHAVNSSSGSVLLNIGIPMEAQNDSIIVFDDGASIQQVHVKNVEQKSAFLEALEENIGKEALVSTEKFNATGTVKEIIRKEFVLLSNSKLVGDKDLTPSGDWMVPISNIIALSIQNKPLTFTQSDKLSKELKVLENATKGDRTLRVQYLTSSASWNPVHNVFLQDDTTAEWQYWANVNNNTQEKWENVTLSVVSGKPKFKSVYRPYYYYAAEDSATKSLGGAPSPSIAPDVSSSESGELHVYSLNAKATVEKNSEALIPVLDESIRYVKEFEWNAAQYSNQVSAIIKFTNTLKEPLPSGWVSVYENGLYAGGDYLTATPKGTEEKLVIGPSLDIHVKRTQNQKSTTAPDHTTTRYDIVLHLESGKSAPVKVTVKDLIPSNAEGFTSSVPVTKTEENINSWDITLQPGEKKDITYSYSTTYYNYR